MQRIHKEIYCLEKSLSPLWKIEVLLNFWIVLHLLRPQILFRFLVHSLMTKAKFLNIKKHYTIFIIKSNMLNWGYKNLMIRYKSIAYVCASRLLSIRCRNKKLIELFFIKEFNITKIPISIMSNWMRLLRKILALIKWVHQKHLPQWELACYLQKMQVILLQSLHKKLKV